MSLTPLDILGSASKYVQIDSGESFLDDNFQNFLSFVALILPLMKSYARKRLDIRVLFYRKPQQQCVQLIKQSAQLAFFIEYLSHNVRGNKDGFALQGDQVGAMGARRLHHGDCAHRGDSHMMSADRFSLEGRSHDLLSGSP